MPEEAPVINRTGSVTLLGSMLKSCSLLGVDMPPRTLITLRGRAARSGKIDGVQQIEIGATSVLGAAPQAVWDRVTTIQGINHELGPWMRMTAPRGTELSVQAVPLGRRWFRSWILLLGVLPFDYDELCIERLDAPAGFLERSRMLSAPVWEHERTLEALPGGGTRVTDRVRFLPRLALAGRIHRAAIAAIFRHRHRRLRAHFARS
jgi:hypothetical protein